MKWPHLNSLACRLSLQSFPSNQNYSPWTWPKMNDSIASSDSPSASSSAQLHKCSGPSVQHLSHSRQGILFSVFIACGYWLRSILDGADRAQAFSLCSEAKPDSCPCWPGTRETYDLSSTWCYFWAWSPAGPLLSAPRPFEPQKFAKLSKDHLTSRCYC